MASVLRWFVGGREEGFTGRDGRRWTRVPWRGWTSRERPFLGGPIPGVEWPAPGPALPPGSMINELVRPPLYEGVPEAMPPVVVPARSTDRPPLVVIPLPARLGVSAAILRALGDVWEREHGQTLTMAHAAAEQTPFIDDRDDASTSADLARALYDAGYRRR